MKATHSFLSWLLVVAGAALVFLAPFSLKGLVMAAGGVILLPIGCVPILKKRKAARSRIEE